MKHTGMVTAVLVGLFIVSQLIGLALIARGTSVSIDNAGGVVVEHADTVLGPRPDTTGFSSFLYLAIGIAVGTIALLLLIKFRLNSVWRVWFLVAVWLGCTVALGSFLSVWWALGFAAILAVWKIFKPNIIIHNVTEVLVYSGIALLVAPILDLLWAGLLLIVIAIYDAYAVWKSKHMVRMATFQTESKLFAGLMIPYTREQTEEAHASRAARAAHAANTQSAHVVASHTAAHTVRTHANAGAREPTSATVASSATAVQPSQSAILGGGDIAFPLLFTGVVFDTLVKEGLGALPAYGYSLFVVAGATAALAGLFIFAKRDTFYPAMPFITAGCFVGVGMLYAVRFFVFYF